MNRFAELLDSLIFTPSRNTKLRLMRDYFSTTPDPERGWALAALTGALSFRHAKPNVIRTLVAERTDPVLFGLSWDYVGDLAETVALIWPKSATTNDRQVNGGEVGRALPSPLEGEGREGGRADPAEFGIDTQPYRSSRLPEQAGDIPSVDAAPLSNSPPRGGRGQVGAGVGRRALQTERPTRCQ